MDYTAVKLATTYTHLCGAYTMLGSVVLMYVYTVVQKQWALFLARPLTDAGTGDLTGPVYILVSLSELSEVRSSTLMQQIDLSYATCVHAVHIFVQLGHGQNNCLFFTHS